MGKYTFLVAIVCAFALGAGPDPSLVINVWPGKPPNESQQIGPERVRNSTTPRVQKEIFDVSVPQLEFFRPPKDKDTGAALIILPGGGFGVLKMDYEGEDAARWLNTIGVTGIVLKYRVPQRQGAPARYTPALQDAQRSLSLVRSKASEWNIDPNRIGIMGFSAGSVAAAVAQTDFEKRRYDVVDDIDKVSCRPDFSVLIYPGTIVEKDQLIADIKVTDRTPPTFIAVSHSDKTENSVYFYLALKRANVPAEMHIYSDGEHGFGMIASPDPHGSWPQRLAEWMNYRKLLKNP